MEIDVNTMIGVLGLLIAGSGVYAAIAWQRIKTAFGLFKLKREWLTDEGEGHPPNYLLIERAILQDGIPAGWRQPEGGA